MLLAADTHIHGFLTRMFDIAHRAHRRCATLFLSLFPLCVTVLLLFGTSFTPLFCKVMRHLDISALSVNPFFLGLSTKALRVSRVELSPSTGLNSSASFESLGFFAGMAVVDCEPFHEVSAGNFVQITLGAAGRHLQGK